MKMIWKRHGILWQPDQSVWWTRSHATCPTPFYLSDGTLRVFVQSRDNENIGRIGYIDLDPNDPRRVIGVAKAPVLEIGVPGAFDDSGVFQTSLVHLPDGKIFMYYVGFELSTKIRYRLLSGLAVSLDGGQSFFRHSETPILERSTDELYFRCGPFVMLDDSRFRMWYVAGSAWCDIGGKSMPTYDLRYLESQDGINWAKSGQVVMQFDDTTEHGFGRPYIVKQPDGFRMHYSIRDRIVERYRLGFATSINGIQWHRKDSEFELIGPTSAIEDVSQEFAAEFSTAGKSWILYNGNDFGRDGILIAEKMA